MLYIEALDYVFQQAVATRDSALKVVAKSGLSTRATTSGTVDGVCDSGSISYVYDSGTNNYSFTYNDCVTSTTIGDDTYTTTISGSVVLKTNDDDSYSYSYNLSVVSSGATEGSYTYTGSLSCDANDNCTYEDNFTSDGVQYKIASASVSGDNTAGYSLAVRVYHEELGYVDVAGEGLISCASGGFSAGTIKVTDRTGAVVLTISFSDGSCSDMTVTYEGVAETVSQ